MTMPALTKAKEGEVEFWAESQSGKSKAEADVFYNPKMQFSRDLSVAALKAFRPESVIDAMSATGIRGLRYAKEVDGIKEVVMNDYSTKAYRLIKKNIRLAKAKNARAENKDANALLSGERTDAVDLDPFGTPAPYMDSAARCADRLIMATATDTAVLCGVYPKVCLRTYGSTVLKTEFCHETSVRILIAHMAKAFALHDKAITPIISQSTDHYIRVFARVEKGSRKADKALENLGYIIHCQACGHRRISEKNRKADHSCESCEAETKIFGPVWSKEILDKEFVKATLKEAEGTGRPEKLLRQLEAEADAEPLYYDMHHICSSLKLTPPKTEKILEAVKAQGYTAVRTHMREQGLKTNCDIKTLKKILAGIA
jgi:tRNA (guanine26-N2/guanine27-N2)-dimethyltransferase